MPIALPGELMSGLFRVEVDGRWRVRPGLPSRQSVSLFAVRLLQLCYFSIHPDIPSTLITRPFRTPDSLLERPSSDTQKSPEINIKLRSEILRASHSQRLHLSQRVLNFQSS